MQTATQSCRSLEDLPDFCTLAELAAVLGISKATAYRMAEQGRIPCIRLGRRIILSKNHLRQWIDQEIGFKIGEENREELAYAETSER